MNKFPSRYVYSAPDLWEPGMIQIQKDDRVIQEVLQKVKVLEDIDEMCIISIRVTDAAIEKMMTVEYGNDE